MRIALTSEGTRGDIAPLLALAERFRDRGHETLFCASPDFAKDAAARQLEFHAIGRSVREFMTAHAGALTRGGVAPLGSIRKYLATALADQFAQLPEAVRGAELIIGAGVQAAAASAAELYGIPYRYVAYCPSVLPSPEHPPVFLPLSRSTPWLNRRLWSLSRFAFNLGMRPALNRHRRALGLPPVSDLLDHLLSTRPVVAADPLLGALPSHRALPFDSIPCLHPFVADPLPAKLEAFLDSGPPPIYLGFGSMTDPNPAATTRILLEAVSKTGCRALISEGWASLGSGALPEGILQLGVVSHAALFQRVAAVVHHGGAGTTTTAARAGAPQILVPHVLDQHYWAQRVQQLGLGAPPIPRSRLTADRLADTLTALLDNELVAERARELGARLREGLGADPTAVFLAREGAASGADRPFSNPQRRSSHDGLRGSEGHPRSVSSGASRPPIQRRRRSPHARQGPMEYREPTASILLLHDGELADLTPVIEPLGGIDRRGHPTDLDRTRPWDVIVASASRMLELPEYMSDTTAVRIAVLDGDSQTLRKMLYRVDTDLLVRQPVHPTALRLLILHSLYTGPEKRRSTRVSMGAPIRFRMGLRRRTGVLAELSTRGCRMLVDPKCHRAAPDKLVTIVLPPEVTGDERPLSLRGHVMRIVQSDGEPDMIAVLFELLGEPARGRLASIVSAHSHGPAVLDEAVSKVRQSAQPPQKGEVPQAPASADRPDPEDDAKRTPDPEEHADLDPPSEPDDETPSERRVQERHTITRRIIALGDEAARVLIGRDLSIGGMRIDPTPGFALGDHLKVAVHVRADGQPLVVSAEIARDDGPDGMALRFVDLSPAARSCLEEMVGALPSIVESNPSNEGAGLVVSEVVDRRAS